ncbi:oligomeric golgi complex component, COG2-domain-containing protein [Scleroderma citrinum]
MPSQTLRAIPKNRSDPYELERLAEELEAREVSAQSTRDADEEPVGRFELPVYIPLSHDNEYLSAETFDVENFLLSRAHTSLPELRAELRDYLSSLKEELVQLINHDYEDFISLSTDLREEGVRLEKMKAPLSALRQQIMVARKGLQDTQDAVQAKLVARAKLREEKALLHLLLEISESVSRLESLLLIPQSEDASNQPKIFAAHLAGSSHSSPVKIQGSRSKHLSRVGMEYTQLLYHISKARAEKCAYVNAIQERVDCIRRTLTSDLNHHFSSTLLSIIDTGDGKIQDLEKAKAASELTECLRVYDNLCLWRTAEEIIKKNVVQPFIRKTLFRDALMAPSSPIVPHISIPATPPVPHSAHVPRTPYTPFTAFTSGRNFLSNSSLPIPFLDESDDPLARLYNQILRFIERDLSCIMDIAERVSLKASTQLLEPTPTVTLNHDEVELHGTQGFDIMANVIWPEIGQAIMDELGFVVFAAGQPDDFRKRHAATQAFIHALEFIAPTTQSVQAMRSHPVYIAFNRRWQLPIYFQLRWKEIIGKLEDSLSTTVINPDGTIYDSVRSPFLTSQAELVWASLASCWSAEIFIQELAPRFWKLTLQLLSRYKSWLEASLPVADPPAKLLAGDKGSGLAQSRASTPQSNYEASSESNAADDLLLKQYATVLVDVNAMRHQIHKLWREQINVALPEPTATEDTDATPEYALLQQLNLLQQVASPLSRQVVALLSRRACDALLPVRSIPSQFRAMSSKRIPTEPSYFVPLIMRPVKAFFGIGTTSSVGERLRESLLKNAATEVFDSVCQRYSQYLTAMKKTEESLRRLKKGKKTTFGIFQSSNTQDDDKDEERIQVQMMLDVEALGQDAQSLGIDTRSVESYTQLIQMVQVEFGDEP